MLKRFAVRVSGCSIYAYAIIYAAGCGVLITTKETSFLPFYLLVPLCTLIINILIRKTVRRKRPNSESRDSFPSNHSASAFIIGFACLAVNTALGAFSLLLAVITGAGRVFLGKHYISDVVAAFLLSATCAALGFILVPRVFI